MYKLRTTRRFDRDVRRAQARGKDLRKLWAITDRLLAGERLERGNRPHRLSGK